MQNEKKSILDAIAKANQAKNLNLNGLSVEDGRGINASALESQLSKNVPVIYYGVDNVTKDSILKKIGITLPGISDYLLIQPLGKYAGQTVYHIVESSDVVRGAQAQTASGSGQYYGGGEAPQLEPDVDEVEEKSKPEESVLDIFARAVVFLWDTIDLSSTKFAAAKTDSSEQPVTKLWIWSKQYSQYCWGDKHNGYTPPDQTMSGYVTYTIQCYLDQAVTGNFQWMYVEILGYWDTNIMATNKDNHRGWANWAVNPSVSIPSGFNFYSCSPTNTNKTKSVTSSVGFDVGVDKDGISGTYSVSKSQTEEISDWEVVLMTINTWKFQQYSPFKGYRTSYPSDAVYYSAGSAKYKLHSLPDLTKNTFNFCTMSVFRTNSVLTKVVNVSTNIEYEPAIVQVKTSWPSWSGYFWYYQTKFPATFQVDMSQVSQG